MESKFKGKEDTEIESVQEKYLPINEKPDTETDSITSLLIGIIKQQNMDVK